MKVALGCRSLQTAQRACVPALLQAQPPRLALLWCSVAALTLGTRAACNAERNAALKGARHACITACMVYLVQPFPEMLKNASRKKASTPSGGG